jgi:hypothetical protein
MQLPALIHKFASLQDQVFQSPGMRQFNDLDSIQFFSALHPATIMAAVSPTWTFTSGQERQEKTVWTMPARAPEAPKK